MSKRLLTPAQERFCAEFLVDLNATAAYRRAYPNASESSADSAGPRLFGNVRIASRIAELQAKRSARTQVTADQVITELAHIGFSDMRRFATWGATGVTLTDSAQLTEDEARCVAEVSESSGKDSSSLRFKLHDKVAALIKLGQHLGIRFTERHEHTGKDGQALPTPVIQVYVPDNGRHEALPATNGTRMLKR